MNNYRNLISYLRDKFNQEGSLDIDELYPDEREAIYNLTGYDYNKLKDIYVRNSDYYNHVIDNLLTEMDEISTTNNMVVNHLRNFGVNNNRIEIALDNIARFRKNPKKDVTLDDFIREELSMARANTKVDKFFGDLSAIAKNNDELKELEDLKQRLLEDYYNFYNSDVAPRLNGRSKLTPRATDAKEKLYEIPSFAKPLDISQNSYLDYMTDTYGGFQSGNVIVVNIKQLRKYLNEKDPKKKEDLYDFMLETFTHEGEHFQRRNYSGGIFLKEITHSKTEQKILSDILEFSPEFKSEEPNMNELAEMSATMREWRQKLARKNHLSGMNAIDDFIENKLTYDEAIETLDQTNGYGQDFVKNIKKKVKQGNISKEEALSKLKKAIVIPAIALPIMFNNQK